jgi:hypothetical protein
MQWAAKFNLPPNDPRFLSVRLREAAEHLHMMTAFDEVIAEARARASRLEQLRKLYGSEADIPPELLTDVAETLTGTSASPLADTPLTTGDPEIDAWEREEFEDTSPIEVIDGPAIGGNVGPAGRALARYSAAR